MRAGCTLGLPRESSASDMPNIEDVEADLATEFSWLYITRLCKKTNCVCRKIGHILCLLF